jgi:hypothetical protein
LRSQLRSETLTAPAAVGLAIDALEGLIAVRRTA